MIPEKYEGEWNQALATYHQVSQNPNATNLAGRLKVNLLESARYAFNDMTENPDVVDYIKDTERRKGFNQTLLHVINTLN